MGSTDSSWYDRLLARISSGEIPKESAGSRQVFLKTAERLARDAEKTYEEAEAARKDMDAADDAVRRAHETLTVEDYDGFLGRGWETTPATPSNLEISSKAAASAHRAYEACRGLTISAIESYNGAARTANDYLRTYNGPEADITTWDWSRDGRVGGSESIRPLTQKILTDRRYDPNDKRINPLARTRWEYEYLKDKGD